MRVRFPSPAPGIRRWATTRKGFVAALAFCVLSGLAVPSGAAELSGYLILTTDYVFRGVSQSDEHGAVQLGADANFQSGWYFGAWGSTVDIGAGTPRQRDLEVNYYLGYTRDVSRKWTIGGNAVAYAYPGAAGLIDYDYTEYSLTSNFDDRLWIEYSYSPDLYHTSESAQNLSLYTEWQAGDLFKFGVGAGYYDVSNLIGDGYANWQIGVTRSFKYLTLDLRYHDASRWLPIISSPDHAGARIVLSAKFQI
ncbi:MAG: TorF family putative porin [Proteobacteria bacterium]|nr:TorF family putative porin [Pseudomonadota bacterium]MDA0993074.1 TorF family putative porin [Pseudomonadota bacterium]